MEDFLRKHGSEVINMLTGITLEELYEIRLEEVEERAAKEKEAAVKKAEANAAKKAIEEKDRIYVTKLLKENWAIDKIQEFTEVPTNKILEIQAAIH